MKAIQILKKKGRPIIASIPIPKRAPNEVLVQVHYTPIHPADLATTLGAYLEKPIPSIFGLEGSGIIVEAPQQDLIGKPVMFYSKTGCWSEYTIPTVYSLIPEGISLEKASLLSVNPLTALSMRRLTQGKSYIINAANSSLGLMLLRITKDQNPMCIVRSLSAKNEILKYGIFRIAEATNVEFKGFLDFEKDRNPCYVGFDFVGGQMTLELLKYIGYGGTLYIEGNMSGENINNLDSKEFIFNRKRILGFHLNTFLENAKTDYKEICEIPSQFESKIVEVFKAEDYNQAMSKYLKAMSKGKILLKFN
ncbi:hypothetical protein SteCoe_28157 [Stentor coeruleus]|uniref:Alcohol dehydrogenase-like N-terminal domain-containing protein n=1 Tax=Stentor coeruleus TaxID=5963 RepID=A0A1R2B8W1_9CILI|nr:hypothetical protein SteCoe_28157 [Stentor coeruleus]